MDFVDCISGCMHRSGGRNQGRAASWGADGTRKRNVTIIEGRKMVIISCIHRICEHSRKPDAPDTCMCASGRVREVNRVLSPRQTVTHEKLTSSRAHTSTLTPSNISPSSPLIPLAIPPYQSSFHPFLSSVLTNFNCCIARYICKCLRIYSYLVQSYLN